MRKTILLPIAFFFCCMVSSSTKAGENSHWHAIARATISEIHKSLIAHGQCKNESDCFNRGFAYFSTHNDGVIFSIFNIIDSNLKKEVVATFIKAALTYKIPKIEINFYDGSIEDRNAKSYFSRKPATKLVIEGKYADN